MRTSIKEISEILRKSLENGFYPNGQLPSERDLAEEFSVSRQTIRAVLSQLLQSDERVQRLPNGRLIHKGQTKTIIFFFPVMISHDCASHFSALWNCAQELNLALRPVYYSDWLDPSLVQGINKADIIVLLPSVKLPPWLVNKLQRCGKPVLVLEFDESSHGLLSVDFFPEQGMEVLLQYLDNQGFKDINLLNVYPVSEVISRRQQVWQKWLRTHGGKGTPYDFIVTPRLHMDDEQCALLRKGIQTGKLPLNRLLLCTTQRAAWLLIRAAADLGLQAGRDFSVACIDGELQAAFSTPSITSIERADPRPFFMRFLTWALSGQPWTDSLYVQVPDVHLIEGESIIRN